MSMEENHETSRAALPAPDPQPDESASAESSEASPRGKRVRYRGPERRRRYPYFLLALAAALLVSAPLAWQWLNTKTEIGATREELARRLAQADQASMEAKLIASTSAETLRETQVKLGFLETRLAEFQTQQEALETLYEQLSRSSDEWALADVEQLLSIATQQLQLTGNIQAAIIALESADQRLERIDRPQAIPLRRAIAIDIEKLQSLPHVDTIGLSTRIENLLTSIETLPLAMETRPTTQETESETPDAELPFWRRLSREAWGELRQLVRVQHVEKVDIPLLSPEQSFFLRENLKLRLLAARHALLARDEKSFKADLKAAEEWFNRYYDLENRGVASAAATLRQLQAREIEFEVPDISETLAQARRLKLSRDVSP
jgi:uroporphyrin-3 C-methyltransferase